jgi:hypothetical protein
MGVKKKLGGERIIATMQTAIDMQRLAALTNPDTELIII